MRYLFVTFFILLFVSCNTFFLAPVKKRIQGEWVQIVPKPPTGTTIIWEFDGSELTIKSDIVVTDSAGNVLVDTTKTFTSPYEVQNKLTRHILVTEVWGVQDIDEWVINQINKREMRITSLVRDPNRKSNIQYDFEKL